MPEIKAIGKQTVHQICSGQVILDLSTAVKELLENSLDAGATSIEIKLKEYGKTCIEVVDNGRGVEEENFQGLTLKHHTSKLQDFGDLTLVETFGFRGEALSSLCALSSMTITTKHKTAKVAHRLDYDNNGKIVKKSCVARQPGTTVILKDIFHTLPVRRKEFEKNVKREYAKLLSLLNAYCLISTKMRISCSNETGKGNKSVVLSTSGADSVIDNISAIFGSKQRASLLEFKQIPPTEEICEHYYLKREEVLEFCNQCTLSGYISSCGPGLGRSSNDRQFYSINKRPCEMQKVSKVVNEVFHMFNRYQYPFVQLDVSTNRDEVDVNVTPDKRKIFMQKEKFIFAIIKTSLLEMYNGQNHAIGFTKSQTLLPVSFLDRKDNIVTPVNAVEKDAIAKQGVKIESDYPKMNEIPSSSTANHESKAFSLSQFHRKASDANPKSFLTQKTNDSQKRSRLQNETAGHEPKHARIDTIFLPTVLDDISKESCPAARLESGTEGEMVDLEKNSESDIKVEKESQHDSFTAGKIQVITDSPNEESEKSSCIVPFSFEAVKRSIKLKQEYKTKLKEDVKNQESLGIFKAKILSADNQQAEVELSKNFDKTCFENMEILGQFNLGFIIARHKNDLFIIDQHASDEKYNFEELQKTTHLLGQPLVIPQKLELTAGERLVMQENADIFNKNGFGFKIKEDESGQEAIYLTKVTSSRNWTFDSSDVSELIFMLTDAPHMLCRPSRVRQMFASRACRKSIMVGTALTENEMKRLVNHMAEMNQPWNCPHGRPTMRHLADLSMILRPNKT